MERRVEIEGSILTRIRGISGQPSDDEEPLYLDGLRASVRAAFEFAVNALEAPMETARPVPAELLSQARFAARRGVPLDTVLRRYLAGYTLIVRFLVQESERAALDYGAALQSLMEAPSASFDGLVAAITEAYTQEAASRLTTAASRRSEQVRRLLNGGLIESPDLSYDLDGWHLGIVAFGSGAEQTVRRIAGEMDRRLLYVRGSGESQGWAWLGSRDEPSTRLPRIDPAAGEILALGRPGQGIEGWRRTHRQALAAFPIARWEGRPLVDYAEVALLAAVLHDDLLVNHLHRTFAVPLETESSIASSLRDTVRAYFSTGGNISSTAARLKINRNTVTNRLRMVEDILGRTLESCRAQLEAALELVEHEERRQAQRQMEQT